MKRTIWLSTQRHISVSCMVVFFILPMLSALGEAAQVTNVITASGNLGTNLTTVGSGVEITGGSRIGGNLFHSFGLFNVANNGSANFVNETGAPTTNILGRVTGGQPSEVLGEIRTTNFGNAGLFLINPAGWVFGSTASLSVGGSFHVSTADSLKFADGSKYYADLNRDSVLTSASVSAFGFLSSNPAGTSIQGSTLQLLPNQTLTVVGGDIQMDDGSVITPNGKIQLASIASLGEVPLSIQSTNLDDFQQLGQVNIARSILNASGDGGGTLVIRGGQLRVNSSQLTANSNNNPDGASFGINFVLGGKVLVESNSTISSETRGPGQAGTINVKANDTVTVSGDSRISAGDLSPFSSSNLPLNTGGGGNVTVEAKNVVMSSGGQISSDTTGFRDGGTVTVKAVDTVTVTETRSKISAGTTGRTDNENFGTGRGGKITVEAKNVVISSGGQITSDSTGVDLGAGTVTVRATDTVTVAGDGTTNSPFCSFDCKPVSSISSSGGRRGHPFDLLGGGGNVTVEAKNVAISGGGQIASQTYVAQPGGSITVRATDLLTVAGAGSAIVASSNRSDPTFAAGSRTGRGGDIAAEAENIIISGGGQIASNTSGTSSGGRITVAANNVTVTDLGSGIFAVQQGSGTFAAGTAGSINLNALGTISLLNSATIRATNSAVGDAGNIEIISGHSFRSVNGSVTTASASGGGGNIHLKVGNLVELSTSQITTSVQGGAGAGGNITIDPQFVVLKNSQVSANAFGGPGGRVTIVADNFFSSPDSTITASSALSTPGTVDIQAPITDLSGSLAPLQEGIVQATSLLRQSCASRYSSGKLSSLASPGRGGMPFEPGGLLASVVAPIGDSSMAQRRSETTSIIASTRPRFSIAAPCGPLY